MRSRLSAPRCRLCRSWLRSPVGSALLVDAEQVARGIPYGASRFLIGLVTCFATHDCIPAVARRSRARSRRCCAAAGLLVTCEIVPRRTGVA